MFFKGKHSHISVSYIFLGVKAQNIHVQDVEIQVYKSY